MKNINERCPFSTECERKKCEHRFKENECKYYYANATVENLISDVDEPDVLDYFDEGEGRQLEYIDIDLIHPHPDNPRKNVGDVTELAESIKHSGIMQNLTVVPYEGEYRVIIGHRRLVASKLAGLSEVPCVVVEMSEREQIATMLSENMQRVDLTICEQTSGIQLMLNLGEDVSSISKKTGFSESTVRRRIKIGTLPSDELKKAEDRGGTLEEYIKCCEIEDEDERRLVLNAVGTNDFKWRYESAVRSQKIKENIPLFEQAMEKVGAKKIKPEVRWNAEYDSYTNLRLDAFEDNENFYKKFDSTTEYAWCIIGEYAYCYIINKKAKNTSKKAEGKQKLTAEEKSCRRLAKRHTNSERNSYLILAITANTRISSKSGPFILLQQILFAAIRRI